MRFFWTILNLSKQSTGKVDTFVDNHLPNGLNRHDNQQKDETSWLARLKPPKKELKTAHDYWLRTQCKKICISSDSQSSQFE